MAERAVLVLPETIKREIKLYKIGENKLSDSHPLIRVLKRLSNDEIDTILAKDGTVVDIEKRSFHSHNCTVKGIKMPIPINWLANDEGLE